MSSLDEIRAGRLKKLQLLKEKGINPYPSKIPRDHSLAEVRASFDALAAPGKELSLAGRIMAIRGQGAIFFVVLFDGTEKFQAVFKKDLMDAEGLALWGDTADIGDFISVTGTLFTTERGEKSILAKRWTMGAKSLLPLPEKWHGLKDSEERYRKRYLDILMNPEHRKILELKAKFWDFTREYLKSRGFIEVETPTLELTTGGAEARPFTTHHNDYDLDLYLRISVGELWQKRLLAAGVPRTFEIGRLYRNEGTSPEHAQEFTNMEFYAGYMDYEEGIVFTEEMIRSLAAAVFGTTKFAARGYSFDLGEKPWPRLDYVATMKKMTGIDLFAATEPEMEAKLRELRVEYDGKTRERLMDALWKHCRKSVGGPAWLVHHPKLVSPLSKAKSDDPRLTERVQLILCGAEATNGFSELNDPQDQRARFEEQQALIERGDNEAMMPDFEFVEMLEHGMPPAFGFAYGDRLFAFLVDKPLREVHTFPLLRPTDTGKSKEQRFAAAIINTGAKLERWQELNTVAHLNAAFGAHVGKSLFAQNAIRTLDDQAIKLNIRHAIMLKEAGSSAELQALSAAAKKVGLEVSEFTREMLLMTSDKKVIGSTKGKKLSDIEFLGVLVFGPRSAVEQLTEKFPLAK